LQFQRRSEVLPQAGEIQLVDDEVLAAKLQFIALTVTGFAHGNDVPRPVVDDAMGEAAPAGLEAGVGICHLLNRADVAGGDFEVA
jgi:hypothetical protein